ncbi:hypothetical protein [Thermococcus sp. 21S7]|uniref:hypothetical protein n=1 Tax=Thermococcus sp. 21S7 TaxID=1638221 RepID=UPI00143AFD75|nr:hypothetical protein [Thermococcus sp. 21S7]NJE60604.1 hypothetical protein [Thermococcus sp. 21S7]
MNMPSRCSLAIFLLLIFSIGASAQMCEHYKDAAEEAQKNGDIRTATLLTGTYLHEIRFHSKAALNALSHGDFDIFNFTMGELYSDLVNLGFALDLIAELVFPEEYGNNMTVTSMTETGSCADFVNKARDAVLSGQGNLSAVREGLILIHDFANQWITGDANSPALKNNSTYVHHFANRWVFSGSLVSRAFLQANGRLEEECELLAHRIDGG